MAIDNRNCDVGYMPLKQVALSCAYADDDTYHNVVVHRFTIGDVDDPDVYAGEHLYNWMNTERGQWVVDNAIETPLWRRHLDFASYSYQYAVVAKMSDRALVYYQLRWG